MSWGVEFTSYIFIRQCRIPENIYQIEDGIKECEKEILNAEKRLAILVGGSPELLREEETTLVSSIENEVRYLVETISDNSRLLYQLVLYKEYVENKTN